MIPNLKHVVEQCKTDHPEAWANAHTGNAQTKDFIKILATALKAQDVRFGLNGKRGDPNNISDDAVNYLCDASESAGRTPEGLPCVVIDCIMGAGGPDPKAGWIVFNTLVEGSGANVDPNAKPKPKPLPPPQPVHKPYPGDDFFVRLGQALESDYTEAGQRLNAGSVVWISRTLWRYLNEGMTIEASTAQSRKEWRAALGLA
jgi:hypothetical protein